MARGLGKNRRGFANSAVTKITGTNVTELGGSVEFYAPFDSDLNDDAQYTLSGTASGSAAVSTSVKKFGAGSLYLPNRSDRVTYDDSGNSISFSGDYTIEAWVYFTDVSQPNNYIWSKRTNTSTHTNNAWALKWMGPSDNAWEIFQAQGSSQHVTFHSDTISTNTWYHLAVVRSGTDLLLFKNGTLISGTNTTSAGGTLNNPTSTPIVLGEISGGTESGFAGYIEDFRIIDGVALYTSNFVAPTSALTSTAEVTSATVETKFLSSVWSLKDQNKKISKGEWIRNDATDTGVNAKGRSIKGAGLEVSGHRHYTAPAFPVTFKVWGAGGAGAYWNGGSAGNGGSGGFAKGTFNGTPGTTYNIVVGTGGVNDGSQSPAATGGNGAGNVGSNSSHVGGQGGGYSGVFEGPVSHSNAFIIAGGGGGGGSFDRDGENESGGGGGGTTGLDAANPGPAQGKGGSQSAGGLGHFPGSGGSALQGGNNRNNFGMSSGGGGGGYYGGGSGDVDGGSDAEETSGGGGGSGYLAPALTTDTANLQGVTGTAGSATGQTTAINPTASSDPDYTGSYGKGGGYNSDGNPGYVVITDPSGTYTFTSPGTHTLP